MMIHVIVCIYIYIYIEREREIDTYIILYICNITYYSINMIKDDIILYYSIVYHIML